MACKLHVAARILESGLDSPDAATAACLLSLEELHGLPAIQEMFSVFIKGGLKSMLKKAEELENILSVLSINHVLYDFASKYCTKSPHPTSLAWNRVDGRTFHPILNADDVLSKTTSGGEFVPQLNRVVDSRIRGPCFAVNSRGEIILLPLDNITIIYRTGERKDVTLPEPTESNEVQWLSLLKAMTMHTLRDDSNHVMNMARSTSLCCTFLTRTTISKMFVYYTSLLQQTGLQM